MTKQVARVVALVVWIAGLVFVSRQDFFWPVGLLPLGLVGLLLVLHRPERVPGWLLLTTASAANYPFEAPEAKFNIAMIGLTGFFVVFPNGRPLSRRWLGAAGLTVVGLVVAPLGLAVTTPQGVGVPIFVVAELSGLFLGLASLVVRYRRGTALEKTQLRWLGWSVGVAGGSVAAALALAAFRVENVLGELLFLLGATSVMLLVPLSIALALFRYRLYDIDRIISRTAAYSVLIVVLGSIYGLIAVGPTLIIGTGNAPDVVVAAGTLACAALFAPLRRRIVAVVDRRFNRSKYRADRELESLSSRLSSAAPGEAQREATQLVDRTLHPATISFWLRGRP